jgi:NADPH-dependent curcumin reductase CurA
MVSSGQRAVVDRAVALEDVPEALLALERGEQFGKIVVSRSEAR